MTNDDSASIAGPMTTMTVAAASPLLGAYATISLAATFGALWTISRADLPRGLIGYWLAAKMFFRAVTLAIVFSSLAAHYVSSWLDHPVHDFLGPVSFFIAWVGDRWIDFRDRAFKALMGLLSRPAADKE